MVILQLDISDVYAPKCNLVILRIPLVRFMLVRLWVVSHSVAGSEISVYTGVWIHMSSIHSSTPIIEWRYIPSGVYERSILFWSWLHFRGWPALSGWMTFFRIDHSSWSCFVRLWARDHHIIFLIKTVTDALSSRDRVCWPLYRYSCCDGLLENPVRLPFCSTRNGPPHTHYDTSDRVPRTLTSLILLPNSVGIQRLERRCFMKLEEIADTFYAHWCRHSRTTICNGRTILSWMEAKDEPTTSDHDSVGPHWDGHTRCRVTWCHCSEMCRRTQLPDSLGDNTRLDASEQTGESTHDGLLRRHRTPHLSYTE
jgi:hypothetical protein